MTIIHYHPINFKITIKTSINTTLYIRFSRKQYLIFNYFDKTIYDKTIFKIQKSIFLRDGNDYY